MWSGSPIRCLRKCRALSTAELGRSVFLMDPERKAQEGRGTSESSLSIASRHSIHRAQGARLQEAVTPLLLEDRDDKEGTGHCPSGSASGHHSGTLILQESKKPVTTTWQDFNIHSDWARADPCPSTPTL